MPFLLNGKHKLQNLLPDDNWTGTTYEHDHHTLTIYQTTLEDVRVLADGIRKKFDHYHRVELVRAFAEALVTAALKQSHGEKAAQSPVPEAA